MNKFTSKKIKFAEKCYICFHVFSPETLNFLQDSDISITISMIKLLTYILLTILSYISCN